MVGLCNVLVLLFAIVFFFSCLYFSELSFLSNQHKHKVLWFDRPGESSPEKDCC